jgi:hypothetical protein
MFLDADTPWLNILEYHWLNTFFFVIETIANAFLCYKLGKHNQVQRLITWANSQQSQDSTSPISSLRKVACGGWAAYIFLAVVFNIAMPAKDYTVGIRMVGTVVYPLGYGLMIYLCFLWLWMNWVLHTAAQHWVQYRLDADGVLGVGGRDAGKELWEILAQMKEVSSMWANNHALRLITTTSIATMFLTLVESELHSGCVNWQIKNQRGGGCYPGMIAYQLTGATVLYLLVWLTAFVPGYITDTLFSNLHRKLYLMRPEPDSDHVDRQIPTASVLPVLTPQQQQQQQHHHPLTPLEAKATALMQQAHHLQGREGMHFAFVPMSLARAITVGTVLSYTIAFATRISH